MKFVYVALFGLAKAELQAWVECDTAYDANGDDFMQIQVEACGADVTAETCAAGVLTYFTPNSYDKHACVALQNGCDPENPTHNRCVFNEFVYTLEDQADLPAMLEAVGDPRVCGTEPGTYAAAILSFGNDVTQPDWYTAIDACADPNPEEAVEEEDEDEDAEDEDSAKGLTSGLVALTAALTLM